MPSIEALTSFTAALVARGDRYLPLLVDSGLRINNCFSLIDKTRGRSLADALLCKALNTYN